MPPGEKCRKERERGEDSATSTPVVRRALEDWRKGFERPPPGARLRGGTGT